jgi:hypothetical protein
MNNVIEEQKSLDQKIGMRLAGKYLTFALDKEEYAIEILKVNTMTTVSKCKESPSFFLNNGIKL